METLIDIFVFTLIVFAASQLAGCLMARRHARLIRDAIRENRQYDILRLEDAASRARRAGEHNMAGTLDGFAEEARQAHAHGLHVCPDVDGDLLFTLAVEVRLSRADAERLARWILDTQEEE